MADIGVFLEDFGEGPNRICFRYGKQFLQAKNCFGNGTRLQKAGNKGRSIRWLRR